MKVVYTKAIVKDVNKINDKKTIAKIEALINTIKEAVSVTEIPHLKKMKGHPNVYRIRMGDYRMGFFLEDDVVVLGRFLKRSDIYKLFP